LGRDFSHESTKNGVILVGRSDKIPRVREE
jgi:hypothetical protein